MRCQYCMAENMHFLPKLARMTANEIITLAHNFIDRGVTRIRLTGGEPLTHPDVITIADNIGSRLGATQSGTLRELTLSTNGALLHKFAAPLCAAGIRRVNISMDTRDPAAFAGITRGGALADVDRGIDAAQSAGLAIKINMVAMRGFNQDQLLPMLEFCNNRGLDLTLIEAMPVGDVDMAMRDAFILMDEFLRPIGGKSALHAVDLRTGGPARYFSTAIAPRVRIGLITALSNNFCAQCNRIRVTASGRVYMCLGQDSHVDLLAPLRAGNTAEFDDRLDLAMRRKSAHHDFDAYSSTTPYAVARHMSVTGG